MIIKNKIQMTEPLISGNYSPVIVHLSKDALSDTRLSIYIPTNVDGDGAPAYTLELEGVAVENLCKILDAWRVKLKFSEEKEDDEDELPF